ncbi:MAG: SpoIID/LytB domain-containing protein, partial [Acidimicrobiia bacterium]
MNSSTTHPTRLRRVLSVLAAFAALLVLPSVPAQAAGSDTITFEGAGWGHGVGMSQYGAYARAADGGQSYETILTDYYQGATIGILGVDGIPDPVTLHTNVASDITSTTVTIRNGPGTGTGVVVTRQTGEVSPPSATLESRPAGTPDDHVTVTDTTPGQGQPDGCALVVTIDGAETDWGVGSCDLTFDMSGSGEPAYLIEATNCRRTNDCTYGYGTAFRIVDNGSSQRSVPDLDGPPGCGGCPEWRGFDLVVETSLDDYTRGIAEVPYSWPSDALKTQAVAARSYAASFAASTNHTAMGCFCDVKNDSSYQVYAGWIAGRQLASAWDAAALATNGEVMTHPSAPDSQIVRAYYSSSNGGASEWVKDKWGSNFPYLVSVPDTWSLTPSNPRSSWEFTFNTDTVVDRVWGSSADHRLTQAEVIAHNTSGSAKTIRFTAMTSEDIEVTKTLSVGSVTSMFGLYSWYFDIDNSGIDGTPSDVPAGASSVGVQDPKTGIWTLQMPDSSVKTFYYGDPKDEPFVGDWDGDGDETVGIYRPSDATFYLRNTNTQGIADIVVPFGNSGDQPIAGDWDGDGVDT